MLRRMPGRTDPWLSDRENLVRMGARVPDQVVEGPEGADVATETLTWGVRPMGRDSVAVKGS